MKKNTKIMLYSILLGLVLIIAGVSYAYFQADIIGVESSATIEANAGNMSLTFADNNPNISAESLAPDPEPFATKTFTITGNSTVTKIVPYSLYLIIDTNTFLDNNISYTLESTNTSGNGTIIPTNTTDGQYINGTTSITLGTGSFAGVVTDNVHTYTLKLYFKESNSDQSNNMDKSIALHIGLTAERAETIPLLTNQILGASNANVTTALTVPGQAISTAEEAVLASTPDDYGTSYYYRGAVENNYVSFANMCWRIVRVTGNGAIKLVLYNYNPNNVSNPCDSTQDGTTNAFARYSGDTYTTAFNANYNQNAYIGFMYGTAGSSSYAAEHANNNKSTILTNLETWYNAKLSSYSSKLADTIWCNDKSTKSTYTVDGTAYGNGLGYSTNQTMYGARDRIYANNKYATGASPTLICANDNNGGKLSKFTADDVAYGNGALTYKIGLLTADEVAFAGGIYGNANSTYYLNKNASGNHWWSLSPYYFGGSYAGEWSVNSTGSLSYNGVNGAYGLRPAVSLASSTTATGSGTQSDPWVIQP